MSETEGVDGGAFHLQFSEKPETPEAERHLEREYRLESPLARGSSDAATSKWWDLEYRLFDHDGHANFRVELARGSPDAATSTRWDLGR
uniref:Uncharacterized protein n=1 Tax=Vespula pensylvanica TaxID=30213 RepID=A0A834PB70_VESPE|nr:hypothetical protein H0235_002560 [Vespula pensylvanica]